MAPKLRGHTFFVSHGIYTKNVRVRSIVLGVVDPVDVVWESLRTEPRSAPSRGSTAHSGVRIPSGGPVSHQALANSLVVLGLAALNIWVSKQALNISPLHFLVTVIVGLSFLAALYWSASALGSQATEARGVRKETLAAPWIDQGEETIAFKMRVISKIGQALDSEMGLYESSEDREDLLLRFEWLLQSLSQLVMGEDSRESLRLDQAILLIARLAPKHGLRYTEIALLESIAVSVSQAEERGVR